MLGNTGSKSGLYTPGKRRRLNVVALCLNIFIPWFLFCGIFAALTFDVHYRRPFWAWFIVATGIAITLATYAIAFRAKTRSKDPAWFMFAGIAMTIAVVLATVLGDMNFHFYMSKYYDISNLQVYEDVKPDMDMGQALMDSGKVYFAAGTTLKATLSAGFMNGDLYCVSAITRGSKMTDYDFWAVGKNCCADRADFRCGEYANRRARSGLRLMEDEDRPFYRLAVQEAEAVFGITSRHPLFFYWMQDPLGEQNAFRDMGFKNFLVAIFSHFAFNLFCVVTATIAFAKIGSKY
eukprot:GHVR01057280.1.p1 GENE.GHVR01057280.1~~GHVR01057280.1.p1  ORF type:complete len:292 (+),score=7.54 GHVR01057280.1:20-895(+)